MPELLLAYIPIGSKSDALALGQSLLEEKLIACANTIGPIISQYWWGDKIEQAEEYILILKTTTDRKNTLASRIEKLHPYDTPCVLTFKPASCNSDYLDWMTGVFK